MIYDSLLGAVQQIFWDSPYSFGTPVTFYYYYVLAMLGLFMVSLGWLLLPVRRIVFIITGAVGIFAVLVYAAVYIGFYTTVGPYQNTYVGVIPFLPLVLATVFQAVSMFVAARTFRQPLFYGASLLLFVSAFATVYTFGQVFAVETLEKIIVYESIVIAVAGLFAALCFLGAPWKSQESGTAVPPPK